jgi:hypothetical protein
MCAMNARLLRPLANRFFLDQHSGARLAFSLRRLSSQYAGPVVKVRRSSDSAEADFAAAEVSGGALAAWVGAGNNGFVRTWYDQSGNGSHAQQATAAAQPKVVDTGSLCVDTKGFPTILCDDNATYGMRVDGSGMFAGNFFIVTVVTPTNNNVAGGGRIFGNVSGTSGLTDFRLDFSNSRMLFFTGASFVDGTFGGFAQGANPIGLFGARILNGPSGTGQIRKNGANFGTNTNIGNHTSGAAQTAISLFSIGPATGNRYVGTMTEFLLWSDSRPNTFQQIDAQLLRHYKLP